MYTVTFKGKAHSVSGRVFWALALPLLAGFALLACWAGWLIYLSSTMLADYTGIPAVACGLAVFVTLGSVTLNGRRKALLPAPLQRGLGLCLAWGTVYYQYAAQHWETLDIILLAAPLVAIGLHKLLARTAT